MDRASDSGSESWGFESLRACQSKSLETAIVSGLFLIFRAKSKILGFVKSAKSAHKSAHNAWHSAKIIGTPERKVYLMANIRVNEKNGKVVSYRFIICL